MARKILAAVEGSIVLGTAGVSGLTPLDLFTMEFWRLSDKDKYSNAHGPTWSVTAVRSSVAGTMVGSISTVVGCGGYGVGTLMWHFYEMLYGKDIEEKLGCLKKLRLQNLLKHFF